MALRLPQARAAPRLPQVAPPARARESFSRARCSLTPAAAAPRRTTSIHMLATCCAVAATLRSLGAPRALACGGGGLGQLTVCAAPRAGGARPRFARLGAAKDSDSGGGAVRGPRQPFGGGCQLSGGRLGRVPCVPTGAEESQPAAAALAAPPEEEQPPASATAAAGAAGAPAPAASHAAVPQQAAQSQLVDAQAAAASASTKQEATGSWLSKVRLMLGSVALALLAQWSPVRELWGALLPLLLRADVAVPLIALPSATLLYRLWSAFDRFGDLTSNMAAGFASQTADAAAAEQRLKAELASQKADTAAGFASQKADAAAGFASQKAELTASEQRLTAELASQKAELTASEQRLKAELTASEQRLKAELTASEQRLKADIKDVKESVLTLDVRWEKRMVDWATAATAMSAGHAAQAEVSAQTAQAAAIAAQVAADVARSASPSRPAAAPGAPTP